MRAIRSSAIESPIAGAKRVRCRHLIVAVESDDETARVRSMRRPTTAAQVQRRFVDPMGVPRSRRSAPAPRDSEAAARPSVKSCAPARLRSSCFASAGSAERAMSRKRAEGIGALQRLARTPPEGECGKLGRASGSHGNWSCRCPLRPRPARCAPVVRFRPRVRFTPQLPARAA